MVKLHNRLHNRWTLGIVAGLTLLMALGFAPAQAAEPSNGEAGDEALIPYTNYAQHFSVSYPQSWSRQTAAGTGVVFTGRDQSVSVEILPLPKQGLKAYAQEDSRALLKTAPGFKKLRLFRSSEVKGAYVLSYEWDAGKSGVTEKPLRDRSDRYYWITKDSRLVVITGSAPIKKFDREQFRDIALSFRALAKK